MDLGEDSIADKDGWKKMVSIVGETKPTGIRNKGIVHPAIVRHHPRFTSGSTMSGVVGLDHYQ